MTQPTYYYQVYKSTMSSLASQLQQIKNNQRAIRVAPNQLQPTLILDSHTATTTSHDLIFTMAVISYGKLLKQHPQLKQQGESLMAVENRQLNRNILTKDVNRGLSQKIIRFLLKISPYFASQECQKVIQYLLHNYKINIFEAEALSIIYLQYWNTKMYLKLIQNIPQKILEIKLPFLTKLSSKQMFNITYIVKSLSYSHFLISSLLIYTLEFIKTEGHSQNSMDIQINLGEDFEQQPQKMARCDPRRFLLQIFTEFMNRQMTSCYKYIIEFCGKAISTSRPASSQTCSMVMLLATRLFIQNNVSQEMIKAIIQKLLKSQERQGSEIKGLFDFLLIIWQRKPSVITQDTLKILEKSQQFLKYVESFKCSLWMILISLLQKWTEGHLYPNLIDRIGNRVKRDQFYLLHQQVFSNKLFQLFEKCILMQLQEKVTFIIEFYKANFQYQIAKYYNQKSCDQSIRQIIKEIFNKQQLNIQKKGVLTFNFSKIKKSTPKAKKNTDVPTFTTQKQEEKYSQDEIFEQRKNHHLTLLAHLRNKGLNVSQVNFKDQKVKQVVAQLLEQYYTTNNKQKITTQQKNQIIDNYFDFYNQKRFLADLKVQDFIAPIKYLTVSSDIQSAKASLNLLIQKPLFFDDVLYRQLMRLSLGHLAKHLNTNYKQSIYYLNTLFKRMIAQRSKQDQSIELLKLSEIFLKISEQTFGKIGIRRGKYQKILHNHGKMIAEIIINLKIKKRVAKQLNADQKAVLDHYIRAIKIFGIENLYLLNIGIIEILTRKEMDHSHVRYFINKIILGAIKQSAFDFQELGLSLAKTTVFCSELGSIIKLNLSQIDPSITSGIAKNAISEFFGLVKDKFKRVMIKKMLMFMKSIFQSTYIVQTFKLSLVELEQNKLQTLLTLYTEIYKILTLVSSEDTQVQNFREAIMDKITNIFPLNLRLVLFQPLLPNQHLYKYLGSQLHEHSPQKSKFQQLQEIVNIEPEFVTFQWVLFVKECLKRGYLLRQESIQKLFPKLDLEVNVTPFAQLICEIAEYEPHILFDHLPICVQIFEKHAEEPNDFTLALATKIIKNLGQMVQPYLNTIILASLRVQSEFTQIFIKQVNQHLANSTLIKFIKQTYKVADSITNFSLFFKQTVMKGVGESLNKTLTSLMNRSLHQKLSLEQSPAQIIMLQSEIFLNIAIKMNQNQLRKSIIDLVRWSESKSEIQADLPFNYRKIAVAQIFTILTQSLHSLFVPFFGYFFDSLIKDFQLISQAYQVAKKGIKSTDLKRDRAENHQIRDSLVELYLQISFKCLQQLFKADNEHQFLDSVKIDTLGDPITELVLLSQHQNFFKLVSTSLTSCIVTLHSCVTDDYQMKTLNYKVLVLLKRKNPKLHKIVFNLMDQLIDRLQDRFLFLVSDLVPFLLQSAGSRQDGIAKVVRNIIGKIQELSGEEITGFAK